MYKLKELHSDTITNSEILDLIKFCDDFGFEDSNYRYNHSSFEQCPNNWYTLMFNELRFAQSVGGLCVAYDNDQIIGISGYNRSNIHPKIYVGAVRTLIHKDYRTALLTTQLFLPYQIKAIENCGGACAIWLFETETENTFYKVIRKESVRKALFRNSRQYHSDIIEHTVSLDYPIMVNNRPLNCLVRNIDKDFKFDWESLKVVGF
jgi:hypothetical protein